MNGQTNTERLQALIDGELGHDEARAVFEQMRDDGQLRAEWADLQELKYLVRSAFDDVNVEAESTRTVVGPRRRLGAIAAAVMLCLGAGWVAHDLLAPSARPEFAAAEPATPMAVVAADQPVLIHLDEPDSTHWQAALDAVEGLLAEQASRPAKVELLVNGGGIGLVDVGRTPYSDRIRQLVQRYPNLALIACSKGMQRLKEQGIDVRLIDEAQTASSALEHVVERLNQGWRYVGI